MRVYADPVRLPTALLLAAIAVAACTFTQREEPPTDLDPTTTFSLPTAPVEDFPTDPPPASIPPGFVFPVPAPLTTGNADIYAQRALFLRTGSLCFTHVDDEGGIDHNAFESMAAKLGGRDGLLEDGRSYLGSLGDALPALDLEPTGIEVNGVAYGIGRVPENRAQPHLPAGSVWTPRLERFDLADGRSGWTLTSGWIAVVPRPCSVLPTTPD